MGTEQVERTAVHRQEVLAPPFGYKWDRYRHSLQAKTLLPLTLWSQQHFRFAAELKFRRPGFQF